jgi:GDPmannose 4,6-dehydratase
LLANPAKARRVLGWQPELPFLELVRLMVDNDLALLRGQPFRQPIAKAA